MVDRYELFKGEQDFYSWMRISQEGDYVKYEDYEKLQAENKRLRKYAQHLPRCNLVSLIRIRLKNGKKVGCTCGLDQKPER